MDVTNPGQVNVANQVYGNPDPNGGSALLVPEQEDVLTQAANQGFAPAANGVDASVFPTPDQVLITGEVPLTPVLSSPVPSAPEIIVDDQVIGQGVWLPNDTMNPAAGKHFVSPAEFVVVGPAESFQTNLSEETDVLCTVTDVKDADTLAAPTSATTRYMLFVGPPTLTSYPVSLLGREILFAEDTTTTADADASRIITGYGADFVVIVKDDPEDEIVPSLTTPVIGDTFWVSIQREGSEQVNTTGNVPTNVFISPQPPTFVPDPSQARQDLGYVNVTTGPQPGEPIITSGVQVPSATNFNVADQATSVGLPKNVNVS